MLENIKAYISIITALRLSGWARFYQEQYIITRPLETLVMSER